MYNFSWKRRLQTSQAIDRGLCTPRTQQHLQLHCNFLLLSSVVIARVSTCRTHQVYWKSKWYARLKARINGWLNKAVSILINSWVLTAYLLNMYETIPHLWERSICLKINNLEHLNNWIKTMISIKKTCESSSRSWPWAWLIYQFSLCRCCTLYPQVVSPFMPRFAKSLKHFLWWVAGIHYEAFTKTP